MRINSRYRDGTRPVFGRILHKEPLLRLRDLTDRSRTFGDISRLYGAESRQAASQYDQPRRRVQFRFSGSGSSSNQNALTPQKGSFQRLKELVWTERARELAQQRKAEETAARAAVLKEIANGHGYVHLFFDGKYLILFAQTPIKLTTHVVWNFFFNDAC